ncbi:MAG: CorA family divalent cation transporter [bacterium]|nr:CorA family divalent cation transporter [bacterium]
MKYVVDHTLQPVPLEDLPNMIADHALILAYMDLKEFLKVAPLLKVKQSTIDLLCMETVHFRSSYYLAEEYVFGIFQLVDVKHIMESSGRIAIFATEDYFFVVSADENNRFISSVLQTALARCKVEDLAVEKVLYLFFDNLLMEDNVALEDIEFEFDLLEDRIVAKKIDEDFYKILIEKKRELFVLHNYYEQFIEFADMLEENELGLFKDKEEKYLKIMDTKFNRLKQNTLLLRENLVQLREAYQAFLDYSLNSVMKLLTVVTTIFLPLTLIVGWYGMNFSSMPELTWRYGYIYVILLTIIVIVLCIWGFKRKKLM